MFNYYAYSVQVRYWRTSGAVARPVPVDANVDVITPKVAVVPDLVAFVRYVVVLELIVPIPPNPDNV